MITTGTKANRGKCLALAAVLAMAVCAFAVALPADSDAADVAYFSGDVSEDQDVAAGVIAEVNGDMNIKNGATFTVSAGATLTVNLGVRVTVDGQGTSVKGGDVLNAKFVVEDGARVIINGEIVIGQYGEAELASLLDVVANTKTGIYTGTFVYGSIAVQNGGVLSIIAEVMDGGSVKVDSDGTQVSAIGGILALLDDATVDIKGNITYALVIGAVGADLSKAFPKNTDILGAAVMLDETDGDSATDVSQLTFTAVTVSNTVYKDVEGAMTECTALVSYLDVSGVVNNADLIIAHSEDVEYKDKATGGKTVELSSAVTVTDELTVTETGSLSVGTDDDVDIPDTEIEAPNFMVSGAVVVAEDAILAILKGTVAVEETGTIDAGTIYVGTTAMKAMSAGATATLSGEGTVDATLIYVAAGAFVDDAILKNLCSVVFQVQGANVVTVYGQSGTEVEAFEPAVKDGKFVCWYLSTDKSQAAQTNVVLGTEAQTMVAKIEASSSTGDSGMKTTDYLLIILVVVIIIIAILVAVRKMKG